MMAPLWVKKILMSAKQMTTRLVFGLALSLENHLELQTISSVGRSDSAWLFTCLLFCILQNASLCAWGEVEADLNGQQGRSRPRDTPYGSYGSFEMTSYLQPKDQDRSSFIDVKMLSYNWILNWVEWFSNSLNAISSSL